ncbi:hypothetical protein FB45DRAFT_890443 [Roridomyces roridus]|uniref:Uncharacterized protein n=1 Tax=Roridomyces roridus TaxID=1738132 RepID=A0AAD7FZX2_9AGAR|nr:hypothetical protein FB45DRAFT_890443 [Roridomyces roridus]
MISPLEITELLECILRFVDHWEDLRSTAVVNHAWAQSSQARLFSHIKLTGRHQPPRLLATLEDSQHLASYIKNLELRALDPILLQSFGNIPFPSLDTLTIHRPSVHDGDAAVAIQRLLSNPGLRSVTINCYFRRRADFLRIWDGCSENIRHLSYIESNGATGTSQLEEGGSDQRRRIKLESFGTSNTSEQTRLWLQDARCPFDISGITAFQFSRRIDPQFAELLAPAMESIQILSTYHPTQIHDISQLTGLKELTFHISPPFTRHFQVIYTIRRESRVYLGTIRFRLLRLPAEEVLELGQQLSELVREFPSLNLVWISVRWALAHGIVESKCFRDLEGKIRLHWDLGSDVRDSEGWNRRITL